MKKVKKKAFARRLANMTNAVASFQNGTGSVAGNLNFEISRHEEFLHSKNGENSD